MIFFTYADIASALHGETDRKTLAALQHVEVYRLLSDLYRHVYGKVLPPLKRGVEGKPYLAASGAPHISLSHDGTLVGAVLSDCEIGLDINRASRAASGRACRRFFTGMKESAILSPDEVTFTSASYREGAAYLPTPFLPLLAKEESDAARYSRAEACLKLSGGGFADLPRLPAISAGAKVCSFLLPVREETYAVSLAVFSDGKKKC